MGEQSLKGSHIKITMILESLHLFRPGYEIYYLQKQNSQKDEYFNTPPNQIH